MKLVRVLSDEFWNTLDASAGLYKKYQMAIHGETPDQCDQKSFFNFLVRSPLQVHFVSNLFVFVKNTENNFQNLSSRALEWTEILVYV